MTAVTGLRTREIVKATAPGGVVRLVRLRRDVWADARLRLLADIGGVPSHRFRNYWDRRAGLTLGPHSSIHWRAEFYSPETITIGDWSTIGDTAFLDGRSGLVIGDCVNLGSHVSIYTRQHDPDDPDFAEVGAPVTVGNYAWLASHCIVLPGVTIGEGAVVAAGAVVSRDVAPYTMVGGVPARYIKDRNRDLRYTLGYAKRFV
jgi:acetyltransferase-like isoleucine patch superfamily enzyme